MLIDDDEDDQYLLMEGLKKLNPLAIIYRTSSCEEALSTLNQITPVIPNILFLDINMPKMNGLEFLRKLRKDHLLENTKIIIYSTSRFEKEIVECKALGAVYCVKPDTYQELIELLKRLL